MVNVVLLCLCCFLFRDWCWCVVVWFVCGWLCVFVCVRVFSIFFIFSFGFLTVIDPMFVFAVLFDWFGCLVCCVGASFSCSFMCILLLLSLFSCCLNVLLVPVCLLFVVCLIVASIGMCVVVFIVVAICVLL